MKNRPRILHVGKYYPPHMGGIETHLQNLCEHLGETADVSVLVANDRPKTEEDVVAGVRVTRLGKMMEIKSAAVCPALTTRISRADADIIHLHLPNPVGALAWLRSNHRAKLVITYHSDIVRQKILGRMMEPLMNAVLSRAAGIIATSPNYLQTSGVLQAHKDRCHVIPYGIPLQSFESTDLAAVAGIRQQYGPKIVLGVGRLVYYKGFDYAIRAMSRVDAKLLLIGDGPLRGELQDLIRSLGLEDRVILLGEVQNSDIPPYYHAADVFVLPSVARSEAFGIVQLEAMMCGLPVINTSLDSGVPFVSRHGETGTTVPPRDDVALADAINGLLQNGDARRAYAHAARRRVQEKFSAREMSRRTIELYTSIFGVRRRPALCPPVRAALSPSFG